MAPVPGTWPVDHVLPFDHDPLAMLTTVGLGIAEIGDVVDNQVWMMAGAGGTVPVIERPVTDPLIGSPAVSRPR